MKRDPGSLLADIDSLLLDSDRLAVDRLLAGDDEHSELADAYWQATTEGLAAQLWRQDPCDCCLRSAGWLHPGECVAEMPRVEPSWPHPSDGSPRVGWMATGAPRVIEVEEAEDV